MYNLLIYVNGLDRTVKHGYFPLVQTCHDPMTSNNLINTSICIYVRVSLSRSFSNTNIAIYWLRFKTYMIMRQFASKQIELFVLFDVATQIIRM